MKADKYGTWAEQVRHSQNWRPGNKHPRCESCAYADIISYKADISAKCRKGNFATRVTACCDHYQQARVATEVAG